MASYFVNNNGNYECPNITIFWKTSPGGAVCPDLPYVQAAIAQCPNGKMVFQAHNRVGPKGGPYTYPYYGTYEIDVKAINVNDTIPYGKISQVRIPLSSMTKIK